MFLPRGSRIPIGAAGPMPPTRPFRGGLTGREQSVGKDYPILIPIVKQKLE